MAGEQEASRSNAGALTLEQTIMFLLETPLFEQLSATELAEVVGIMQVQRLREGQVLFREGDEGDAWYVIFEGMCSVRKESDVGPSRHIADLGPRTCFGEMAVLDGSARSAAVAAVEPTTLFRFRRGPFSGLLSSGSLAAFKLVHAMARVLCHRQRQITQQLSEVINEEPTDRRKALRAQLGTLLDSSAVSE